MNLLWRISQYLVVVLGIVAVVVVLPFLQISLKEQPIQYILSAIFLFFASSIVTQVLKKLYFSWRFADTKKKLSAASLNLITSQRGLPFSLSIGLGESIVNTLSKFNLIELESFPTSNYTPTIYYYTSLGRLLLKEGLKLELCPENFCKMYLIRFWKGYPRESTKIKNKFKKKYKISWETCWNIFHDIFRAKMEEQGKQIKEEEIVPLFDDYFRKKGFVSIMEEIVNSWKQQVDKRRMKNFRIYFSYP